MPVNINKIYWIFFLSDMILSYFMSILHSNIYLKKKDAPKFCTPSDW